jgi:CRP/FNR family cyclic AMP-dependent transcriptional regulator
MKTMHTKETHREPPATPAQSPATAPPIGGYSHPLYGLVQKQPFFKGLSSAQLLVLAESAVIMQYGAGEQIFAEGDQANRFYLILEGSVSLLADAADRRTLPIQTLGPGDDLGWSWLFPPYLMHFGARAIEPTRVILFYGTRLRQQCEEDHDLGYELMKRIAAVMMDRLQATRQRWLDSQTLG